MGGDVKKLNWGSGPVRAEGWINSDVIDYGQEHVGSILDGLPFDVGSLDGIVANHSLQCLAAAELDRAAAELHRALRKDGRLRVLVPDVVEAFDAWQRQRHGWPGFAAITEDWNLNRKFCHYVTWGGQNRSVFTLDTLGDLLERNGFTLAPNWWKARYADPGAHEWGWLAELDSRLGESLVVEAVA